MLKSCLAAFVLVLAGPAAAQILPNVPNVGGAVGNVAGAPVGEIERTTRDVGRATTNQLRNARALAERQLRRTYPEQIDSDFNGANIIRSEIVALSLTSQALAQLRARGFSERETVASDDLGLSIVVLAAPANVSTRRALEIARELDAAGAYDFNHLYAGSGGAGASAKQRPAASSGARITNARLGLIDSGADAQHEALLGVNLQQRGFGGAARAGAHGTAVASLIANAYEAPGATLYVADVYGGRPTGGGATAIVAALNWLVQSRATVINVSLVGPPNRVLEAAISAALARGCVVVAAVGNDGPAAAPLYPASYPGVIGVTGVDARNRILPEAGRGSQVDFAAPGAGFSSAAPGGAYVAVRGTSYASPIVAGLIARQMTASTPDAPARAQAALARTALDLGARGADTTFGAGLVGQDLRGARLVAARR